MTEDLQLMRDDIVDSAYEELVAQVNAMIDVAVRQERERCSAICDEETGPVLNGCPAAFFDGGCDMAKYLAAEIRNQGENK